MSPVTHMAPTRVPSRPREKKPRSPGSGANEESAPPLTGVLAENAHPFEKRVRLSHLVVES